MLLSTERLSLSPIWQLQKRAYDRLGVESWAKGRVPFLMTNNSRFALQVADIACAAFPNKPFTILELGGGCGKFAFLLLSELIKRKTHKIRYLLTDAAEKNVLYWENHPRLKPLIEEGILQTAVFDPISADSPPADIILANYFFDSIPQDLFRVEKGVLLEGKATLHAEVEKADWEDLNLLSKIRIEYVFQPLEEDLYPEIPEALPLLEEYSKRSNDFSFLFPIGALRAIRRIESSSKENFLLLAADRGPCRADDMPLLPTLHGSAFSFPVNFHAIGRYMEKKGGVDLFSECRTDSFTVAFLSPKPEFPKRCFENQKFGSLKTEATHFADILKRLEEANWDATLFFSFFDRVQEEFSQTMESEKKEMLEGMRKIIDRFFPLFREEAILLERLGEFFKSLKEQEVAQAHFQMASLLNTLPRQGSFLEAFLEDSSAFGDVLQIGCKKRSLENDSSKYVHIAWNGSIDSLGKFDTILLFPPRVAAEKKTPAFIRDIEERFSLSEIRYSDADIEMFLSSISSTGHVLHFMEELVRKKNITKEQFERTLKHLEMEIEIQEEDRFFETLMVCLKKHMKPGAAIRAFIPGVSTYDDPRYYDEIIVDPFLETEETREPEGVWIAIKNTYTS
jgi:hypothetical protein